MMMDRFVGGCILVALLTVWHVATAISDPCDTVNTIQTISNRSVSNVLNDTDQYICDDELEEGWYRMEWYDMPLDPQPLYACGTKFPIWLNDDIPIEDGTDYNLTACGVTTNDSCFAEIEILVKNCGLYRVYYLQALPFCNFGYCFDPVPDTERDPAPVFEQHVVLSINDALPDDTSLIFRCEFATVDDDFFYTFSWFMNTRLIKKKTSLSVANLADHYLHQDDITEKDVNIRCGVQASASPGGHLSPIRESSDLFIGIMIETPSIIVEETSNTPVPVKMRPHVPIRCITGESPCEFRISQIRTFDKSVCPSWDVTLNHRCRKEISMDDWNKTITFDVSVKRTIGNNIGGNSRILRLMVPADPLINPFWHNYQLANIWVQYSSGSSIWKHKECHAHVDPHHRNFDGSSFEVQAGGIFWMYKHSSLPLEVQMKTRSCLGNGRSPYCACAVAVRAGRDVFVISVCSSPPFVGMLSCGDGILTVMEVKADSSYKIFLPSGTIVNPYKYHWHGTHLNLKIIPSPRDIGQTSGLCGVLSGNKNDDFCLRHDITDCQNSFNRWLGPDRFFNSWIVQPRENLFDLHSAIYSNLPKWEENVTMCVCPFNSEELNKIPVEDEDEANQADCSKKLYNECYLNALKGMKERAFKCTIKNSNNVLHRRRREAVRRMQRLPEQRQKRSEENSTTTDSTQEWTEEAAAAECRKSMENSTTYWTCIETADIDVNDSLAECEADIMLTNSTEWVSASLESVLRSCINQIQMNNTVVVIDENGTYLANETEDYNPGYDIENSYCPYDCNGHGTCENGTCTCHENFGRGDCSFDLTIPPPIEDIFNEGLCDNSNMDCDEISVYGENFIESDNLTCHIWSYEISSTGDDSEKQMHIVPGDYISEYEVSCPVPVIGNETDIPFVSAYEMSISNNGELFGDKWPVFVYNGDCVIEENMLFNQSDQCCYIDRQFYSVQDINTNNSLQICDPLRSENDWSDKLVCQPFKYGYNCQQPCTCIEENSVNCDDDTGMCKCMLGLTGDNCEIDVDDCISRPCPVDSNCTDYTGFYNCSCGIGRFIVEDACVGCVNNKYGQECKDTCQCVGNNTANCSSIDGQCTCLEGWTGLLCETDIIECDTNPCQEHAACTDAGGSYKCSCEKGYEPHEETCQECAEGTYGTGCQEMCQCNSSYTQSCSKTDGNCTCKEGWQGEICDLDINECSADPCPMHSTCSNTQGSHKCACENGYFKKKLKCKETKSFEITMKLDAKPEWNTKGDTKYMATIIDLKATLMNYYTDTLEDEFLGLVILEITHGSIDVQHVVYMASSLNAASLMMGALDNAIQEPDALKYNNDSVSVSRISTLDVNHESVVWLPEDLESRCIFFTALEPCPANEICKTSGDGTFQCVQRKSKDIFPLGTIIAVSVTSLVFLVVIFILFLVIRKRRTNKEKNTSDSDTRIPAWVRYFPTIRHKRNVPERYGNDNGASVLKEKHSRNNEYGTGADSSLNFDKLGFRGSRRHSFSYYRGCDPYFGGYGNGVDKRKENQRRSTDFDSGVVDNSSYFDMDFSGSRRHSFSSNRGRDRPSDNYGNAVNQWKKTRRVETEPDYDAFNKSLYFDMDSHSNQRQDGFTD